MKNQTENTSGSSIKILNEDLKNHAFRPVYCLYGEENFLKRSYRSRFIREMLGDDTMNLQVFEGSSLDLKEVIDSAETMPFFGEKRLIILEDTGLFRKESGILADALADLPDTTCLLFIEDSVDKRNKLYKKVSQIGFAAQLDHQEEKDLMQWAAAILKKEGKNISRGTMEYFLSLTGNDMERIRNELEKVISYTGEKNIVTEEDVKAICSRQIEGKIFDMIREVSSGNQKEALSLYYDLLSLKEPPLRILALLMRQFNQLLQIRLMSEKRMDMGSIARELGLSPYIAGKLRQQAEAFSTERLTEIVKECILSDEGIKTGKITDMLAVEMLIVKFSS